MFKNTFQSGFLSILYSIGSKPLQIWDKKVRNGHIKRITDPDIQSFVLEIVGTNVSTTYITCPADPRKTLGIKLPYLVMIVKNMKKYFTFEVQVLDDKNVRRRFRASNYQSTTRVKPFICTMPMRLGRMESNSIQSRRFHTKSIRDQLCRNIASANSRQLSDPTSLLFRSFVFRGRVTGRVQIVFTRTAKATRGYEFNGSSPTERTSRHRK